MNPAFVRSIHDPERLPLQQQQRDARENVEERLAEYGIEDVPEAVLRKLTYAYYHDWEVDDPQYVFLLADPGVPGEHVVFETNAYAELGPEMDLHEAIQVDRRFGARWLVSGTYADFTREFIEICTEADLIAPEQPWWRYLLSGGFYNDFYMGDVIKYRGANVRAGDVEASFTEFLVHELEHVAPDLIIAFGKRAWEAVADRLEATPVNSAPDSDSVIDTHGVLHATDRLIETAVLPLGHPSPNFRGAQLAHPVYMEGVRDGLQQFQTIDSTDNSSG